MDKLRRTEMAEGAPERTEVQLESESRKRYLFVINELGFIYSHFWDLALAIQEAGWEVAIAGGAVSNPQRALQAGMKFYQIQPTFGVGNPVSELRSFLELRAVIRSVRPDAIHAVSLKNILLGGVLARCEHVPALLSAVTGLGTMFVEERRLYRFLRPVVLRVLRFIHRGKNSILAFENPDDRQYFIDERIVQPAHAFLIPGAGLDPEAITPGTQQSGSPIILCVTRMIRSKGILELVDAAKLLRARGLHFALNLVGDIDPRNPTSLTPDELQGIQSEGVATWLGRRSDVPSLLRSASIFCLPSYYREGMPRSLIESSAAGLPIVTTDMPGCREVVEDGVTGFLVPPRDVHTLADVLATLIQSPELRRRMGSASRKRFEEKFTTASVLRAFSRCYAAMNISLMLRSAESR